MFKCGCFWLYITSPRCSSSKALTTQRSGRLPRTCLWTREATFKLIPWKGYEDEITVERERKAFWNSEIRNEICAQSVFLQLHRTGLDLSHVCTRAHTYSSTNALTYPNMVIQILCLSATDLCCKMRLWFQPWQSWQQLCRSSNSSNCKPNRRFVSGVTRYHFYSNDEFTASCAVKHSAKAK